MLRDRVLTGIIVVPLFLWLLFKAHSDVFMSVMYGILCIAAWEWSALMGLKTLSHKLTYTVLAAIVLAVGMVPFNPDIFVIASSKWIHYCLLFWLLAAVQIAYYPKLFFNWNRSILIKAIVGLALFLPAFAAIGILFDTQEGAFALLFGLAIVWAADIGGYFFGKSFGKTKLMPKVSPGKTIEGFIGGLVGSLAVGSVFLFYLKLPGNIGLWLLLIVITTVMSVVGDLFESLMKREQGLKDSGNILPGHGGILDRIDGLTAALPTFAAGYFGITEGYFSMPVLI